MTTDCPEPSCNNQDMETHSTIPPAPTSLQAASFISDSSQADLQVTDGSLLKPLNSDKNDNGNSPLPAPTVTSCAASDISLLDVQYARLMAGFEDKLKNLRQRVISEDKPTQRLDIDLLGDAFIGIKVWTYEITGDAEASAKFLNLLPGDLKEKVHQILTDLESSLDSVDIQADGSLEEILQNPRPQSHSPIVAAVRTLVRRLQAIKSNVLLALSEAQTTDSNTQVLLVSIRPAPIILSLDGGGVKTYSSLLILKALMETIAKEARRREEGSDAFPKKPSDIFDLMFGSSSGGLAAIMLGRLEMNVDESMESFRKYAAEVFGKSRKRRTLLQPFLKSKYNETRIIKASRQLVDQFNPVPDHQKWGRNEFRAPEGRCKTCILATALILEYPTPYMFRTYDCQCSTNSLSTEKFTCSPGPASTAEVWEVARATSATPLLFPPITLDGVNFIEGGLVANNPIREAFREVLYLRGSLADTCVVSIGSGSPIFPPSDRVASIKHGKIFGKYRDAIRYMRRTVTNTATANEHAQQEAATYSGCEFFRFNTAYDREIALDEWSQSTIESITLATHRYLDTSEVQEMLRDCARAVLSRMVAAAETFRANQYVYVPYSPTPTNLRPQQ